MKILKWSSAGLVLLALVFWLVSSQRPGKTARPEVPTSGVPTQPAQIELGALDVFLLQEQVLSEGVPVAGSVRAIRTAWVKSKVAGELQDFMLREGDAVKAGQLIGKIDPIEYERRLRQSRELALAAQGQVDIAQKLFQNNQNLVQQGFISQSALETSRFSLQSAQASLRAAQAGSEVALKSLEDSIMRAPISGLVSTRGAQNRERLPIDARVVEIVDLSQLEVEANLSPSEAARVRVGQTALLKIEGQPNQTPAKVSRINPSVQSQSRNVLVYLELGATAGIRQGQFAQGQIGASQTKTLALPLTAIRNDQSVPYVQWVSDKQVKHTPVRIGLHGTLANDPEGEVWVQVEGLPSGTQVLAGHLGRLREGAPVARTDAAGH